jgi:hypothetical protein
MIFLWQILMMADKQLLSCILCIAIIPGQQQSCVNCWCELIEVPLGLNCNSAGSPCQGISITKEAVRCTGKGLGDKSRRVLGSSWVLQVLAS